MLAAFARQHGCRRALVLRINGQANARRTSSTYEAHAKALARRAVTDTKGKGKGKAGVDRAEAEGLAATRPGAAGDVGGAKGCNREQKPEEQELEPLSPPRSFADLGFEPSIVQALQKAFPNVQHPTLIQERLIPAILSGKDVLLKDATGSGKSFGLVLALLNKPRLLMHDAQGGPAKRVITTLLIVPHRDLALQFLHWIERITSAMQPAPSLASIAQVLVRGSSAQPLDAAVELLKTTPPHILICTPQALLEAHKEHQAALRLETLSAVVVDEVDYLVETAARKEEGRSWKVAHEKQLRKLATHPGPTREILDVIYARRKELSANAYDPEEDEEEEYETVGAWRNEKEAEEGHPQLVLSSATLRVHLKDYLFVESGWLNPYNLEKIVGEATTKKDRGRILHSVLVVGDKDVRNVESAVAAAEVPVAAEVAAEATSENVEEEDAEANRYYDEKYGRTPSPFNADALEAVATGFALDVPSIALLVIPSSAPVQRAVYELRTMGVNAEGLDVQVGARGKDYLLHNDVDVVRANPRLLVATLATTRGLDLPELSHVFILGVPEGPKVTGRSVDAYLHIAGRVGRFGRIGRVVTVLEAETDGWRMERILGSVGERAVRFDHFD